MSGGLLTAAAASEERRRVYGRRKGKKLRAGRQALVDELLPRLQLDLPPSGPLDPAALFPRPILGLWLEIGFGAGEHLVAQARAHPELGFIGCEPYLNGMAACVAQVAESGLDNVRLFGDDARLILERLPRATLGRAHILFPDPWPKVRHHRRRIVSMPVLDLLAAALTDEAELRLATDHMDYARWMLAHLMRHPAFEWLAERPADWQARAEDETPTRYEQKALDQGLKPIYLRFRRRPRAG
ncbi:tRNA (guanosine(46)-N7)-methyltransferase TrmB [Desertibaculum subflavum]|uniref:tRNA (guanosine(46)-N7)-methyltransferase TrmB n=1 Tax=Desertibaculum subflavum TaxID=2268458 RepID=UPI0034D36AB2